MRTGGQENPGPETILRKAVGFRARMKSALTSFSGGMRFGRQEGLGIEKYVPSHVVASPHQIGP